MMVDDQFYVKVADHMPIPLPRPKKRENKLIEDGVEIPIIHILCEGEEW